MPQAKAPIPSRVVLPFVLLAGGIAVIIWMTLKAHEYYYPNVRFGHSVTNPRATFTAERTGRYEILYDDELGDLFTALEP